MADLLGHEAALFLPSGTMCNAISFRLHVRPGGDEILLDRTSHPINAEAGGPAAISSAMLHPLDGDGGRFTAAQVREAIRPPDRYLPRSAARLGRADDEPRRRAHLAAGADPRRARGGARATGCARTSTAPGCSTRSWPRASSAADYARGFDTAWIDFTKGLGAPVGACLAASRELIDEAWRYKQMWGGAFRQSGIVAAAGLYALDHHVERLAEDHANARLLAERLAGAAGRRARPGDGRDQHRDLRGSRPATGSSTRWRARASRSAGSAPTMIRMVTHLDVDRAGCEQALAAARAALGS